MENHPQDRRVSIHLRLNGDLLNTLKERAAKIGIPVQFYIQNVLMTAMDEDKNFALITAARHAMLASYYTQVIMRSLTDIDVKAVQETVGRAVNATLGDPPPLPGTLPRRSDVEQMDFSTQLLKLVDTFAIDPFDMNLRKATS